MKKYFTYLAYFSSTDWVRAATHDTLEEAETYIGQAFGNEQRDGSFPDFQIALIEQR